MSCTSTVLSGRAAVVAAIVMLNGGGATAGTTIHVPGDADTIQDAIGLALAGDLVLVAPGVYEEAIDFLGKAIEVRAAEGPTVTLIDASSVPDTSTVRFVSGEGADAVLTGFSITGGSGTLVVVGPIQLVAGGGLVIVASAPTITDCVFPDNFAPSGGAGFIGSGAAPTLTGCIFVGNEATHTGGALYIAQSSPTIEQCVFEENSAGAGGAIRVYVATPSIIDSVFVGNLAVSIDGGAIANGPAAHPHIERCLFLENGSTNWWGGAIYNVDSSSPTVISSRFIGNFASAGGAVTNHNFGTPLYVNCLFAANQAVHGGAGFDHSDGKPTYVNCTFVDNVATNSGGAIRRHFTAVGQLAALRNCIVSGNSSPQISSDGSPLPSISHSLVTGGFAGAGNIDAVPVFVQPVGPGGADNHLDADYRLAPGSPGIDAGNNAEVPDGIVTDLAGAPRFVDDPESPDCAQAPRTCGEAPIVDMGAYEFQVAPSAPSADLNGDGIVDGADLGLLLTSWGPCAPVESCPADLNGDGVVDGADLGLLLTAWST